jgi:hypothetical protein
MLTWGQPPPGCPVELGSTILIPRRRTGTGSKASLARSEQPRAAVPTWFPPTSRFRAAAGQITLQSHFADRVELPFQPVDMLFFVGENSSQKIA